MSHSKLRAGKICLNCGSPTPERFCPVCGQENIEPRLSIGHQVTHFFSDITHFDGKFFVPVKDLFRKPGFLSKEYMAGRPASYLDPIRMYVFTSAFFFIIFFSMFNVKNMHIGKVAMSSNDTTQVLDKILKHAETAADSANIRKAFAFPGKGQMNDLLDSIKKNDQSSFSRLGKQYHSVGQYDSTQLALPAEKRDGWMVRTLKKKGIELNKRYHDDRTVLIRELIPSFLHNLPKFLFLSLPVFALLLNMLYVRRKKFYYVDHGIFTVHLYIFPFLVLLVYFGIIKFGSFTGWTWLLWIELAIVLFSFWYFYKAIRNFYHQGRFKTIVKYLLLCVLSFTVQLTLFIFYLLFSLLEV